MSTQSLSEIYESHYDSLTSEAARVQFLLRLKFMGRDTPEAKDTFEKLARRWIDEDIVE